jgi:hypothetical protein
MPLVQALLADFQVVVLLLLAPPLVRWTIQTPDKAVLAVHPPGDMHRKARQMEAVPHRLAMLAVVPQAINTPPPACPLIRLVRLLAATLAALH